MKTIPPALTELIRDAFARVPYPGDQNLRGSSEGSEPFEVESAFRGKTDWTSIPAKWLDQAPQGLGSALSFFSPAAFRFYIPAYMLADLQEGLGHADPMFYLTHGLEKSSQSRRVNDSRYGELTWRDYTISRFQDFDSEQRKAVVAYLMAKRESGELLDSQVAAIDEALEAFWGRDEG